MARIKLTDEVIQELRRLREETGIGPQLLLRGCAEVPKGLSAAAITAWLRGTTKRANEHHLNFAIERWRSVTPRVKITRAHLTEIKRHALRSGVVWHSLLSSIEPRPEGLDSRTISGWVNGYVKTARADHLNAVIEALQSLPDKQVSAPKPYRGRAHDYQHRAFTECDRETLIFERDRTGISQARLLNEYWPGDVPAGLTTTMISSWINGSPKTIATVLYDQTLRVWKSLPDATGK